LQLAYHIFAKFTQAKYTTLQNQNYNKANVHNKCMPEIYTCTIQKLKAPLRNLGEGRKALI